MNALVLKPAPTLALALAPSPATYRIIKRLDILPDQATFLCLPRRLEDPLLDGSTLFPRLKSELLVIKKRAYPSALRTEADLLSSLHRLPNASSFIGARIVREQHTGFPETSHLVLRPLFASPLDVFGTKCLATQRLPSWFVWHIFLSMVSAVDFLHSADIAHGSLNAASVVLRHNGTQQFRDYPDVVLTNFGSAQRGASEEAKAEDLRGVMRLFLSVFERFSDAGAFCAYTEWEMQEDPLYMVASSFKDVLEGRMGEVTAEEIRRGWDTWTIRASQVRAEGPEKCPEWIVMAAYDQLATEEELEKGLGETVVLTFQRKAERFREWARERRTPVALRERDGTRSLAVIKFTFNREEVAQVWRS